MTGAWWRQAALVVGAAVALAVAWRLRTVVIPFVLALVVAYLLEPLVSLLERRQVPRSAAILTVFLALAVAAGVAWVSIMPSAMAELEQLARRLPEQSRQWAEAAERLSRRLRLDTLPAGVDRLTQALTTRIERGVEALAARLGGLVVATLSQVLNLVLTPVVAYYILRDRERVAASLLTLVPPARRQAVVSLALEIDQTLAAVIRGQLLVSMMVGAMVALGLVLLEVPYALLLGLLTGLLNIVPYFGPIAVGVPIVALALTRSPVTALWAVGLLVAANQVESVLLQPRVMSRSSGLHPLAVIAAVLAGAELGGLVGMLVAVPVASVLRDLVRFALREAGILERAPARQPEEPGPAPSPRPGGARPPAVQVEKRSQALP